MENAILDAIAADLLPIIAIIGGLSTACIITVVSGRRFKAREHTRRELAAYVAEGSMTPQDAERLLTAEPADE